MTSSSRSKLFVLGLLSSVCINTADAGGRRTSHNKTRTFRAAKHNHKRVTLPHQKFQKHHNFGQKHHAFGQKHATFGQKHKAFTQKHVTFGQKHHVFGKKHHVVPKQTLKPYTPKFNTTKRLVPRTRTLMLPKANRYRGLGNGKWSLQVLGGKKQGRSNSGQDVVFPYERGTVNGGTVLPDGSVFPNMTIPREVSPPTQPAPTNEKTGIFKKIFGGKK